MEADIGKTMNALKVDGGASANNLLMQLQSDYLNRPITRPEVIETTVAGACFLAGLGEGVWSSVAEIGRIWRSDQEFTARLTDAERAERLASWHLAVDRALYSPL